VTRSEWISVIALIIASGGFAIQARNWYFIGPRLRLVLIADATSFPGIDKARKLALMVINRGDTPTVLTHMVARRYKSKWLRWVRPAYESRWLWWLAHKAVARTWGYKQPDDSS
jgi:hypothetical protein